MRPTDTAIYRKRHRFGWMIDYNNKSLHMSVQILTSLWCLSNQIVSITNKSNHDFGYKIRNIFDYEINLLSPGTCCNSPSALLTGWYNHISTGTLYLFNLHLSYLSWEVCVSLRTSPLPFIKKVDIICIKCYFYA